MFINPFAIGILLGAIVGWLGYRARALTGPGAVAAACIGAVVYGFGGLGAAIIVIVFFVSSSVLSRFKAKQKENIQRNFEKGSRRDIWQVLANGGIAALCITLSAPGDFLLARVGFIGAMAVATADTWGTEIGVLSRQKPRSILTGAVVPHGTSGGVSMLGTGASIIGALMIGAAGLFLVDDLRVIPIGMIGGVAGVMFDSLLGAHWQAMYFCPVCKLETESHPAHHCGFESVYQRGWRWMNNDVVNFLATVAGVAVSAGMVLLWM